MGIPIVFYLIVSSSWNSSSYQRPPEGERERKNDKLAQKPHAQVQNSKTQMDKVILNNKKNERTPKVLGDLVGEENPGS